MSDIFCITKLEVDIGAKQVGKSVIDNLYTSITKIVNARLNEMLKADEEHQLEKSGKIISGSQSLRDTLKASLSKHRQQNSSDASN